MVVIRLLGSRSSLRAMPWQDLHNHMGSVTFLSCARTCFTMFPSLVLLGSVLAASSLVHAATRQFYIQAAWGTGSPDGYARQMILVNGTSPGPALVVDQGDDVEVRFSKHQAFLSVVWGVPFSGRSIWPSSLQSQTMARSQACRDTGTAFHLIVLMPFTVLRSERP